MDFVVFIKKSQCQCIHTEFDLDPSQSQNANTVVSSKFKSLTGHLYCKTIEQIVHSFTHAYINCLYFITIKDRIYYTCFRECVSPNPNLMMTKNISNEFVLYSLALSGRY